ncbi:hypothetical protein DFS34DRAFT_259642 [Phlyctochytrium arcticum]|nr:hypothetical protein DFS34DRAFT_259642 [Phlyctochytrium arcticum]
MDSHKVAGTSGIITLEAYFRSMYLQERIPPAHVESPDADGYYQFDVIPLGMVQGWYYLPYRLTDFQWKWAAFSWAMGTSSCILGILFFWIVRRVPWSPAKYFVVNLVVVDRIELFLSSTIWHPSAVLYGNHWHGYYTCQIMGYASGFWGITSQSFTFFFILERYLSLVHRFTVNNWQAKQIALSVYISGLMTSATPFIFGRMSSVAPSGLYCQPIYKFSASLPSLSFQYDFLGSNGGDWVGFFLGIVALIFVSANLIGAAIMYLQIYQKYVRVTRERKMPLRGAERFMPPPMLRVNAQPTTRSQSGSCPRNLFLLSKKGAQ